MCSAADLFAKTWGNSMVPFLVACFILNAIMSKTGLTRRIALWFITRPFCQGKPWRMVFWLMFRYLMKPEVGRLAELDIEALRASIPPMSKRERLVAVTYALVIVVWLCPDLFNAVGLTAVGGFMKRLGTGVPALVAAGLLCGITVDGEPIITMQEANKGVAIKAWHGTRCIL